GSPPPPRPRPPVIQKRTRPHRQILHIAFRIRHRIQQPRRISLVILQQRRARHRLIRNTLPANPNRMLRRRRFFLRRRRVTLLRRLLVLRVFVFIGILREDSRRRQEQNRSN